MAQVNTRTKEAATYIGQETTFGTLAGTMLRAFPVEKSFMPDIEQTELENSDQRTTLYSQLATVRGLKDGKLKLDFYGKVNSTQNSDGVTATPDYLNQIIYTALGEIKFDQGSLVAAGSTTTVVNVSTGDGANFVVGQWIAVVVAGTLEPCRVVAIATDALTVYPPLSGTPGTGGAVISGVTHAPATNHDKTLSLQHAMVGAADQQWTLVGNTLNLGIEIKRNEIMKLMFEGAVGSWTGPSNQSITTAADTDTCTSPFSVRDCTVWFRAAGTGTATRTAYPVAEFTVKTNGKMEHIDELGGVEGKTGAFRKGQRLFAEATLKFRYDNAIDASVWSSQTVYQAVVVVPKGSGTAKRFIVVDLPYVRIVGKPKIVDEAGMVYMEINLQASEDLSIASPLTDMAQAPFRLALI